VVIAGSPMSVRAGSYLAALEAIVAEYNAFVGGTGDTVPGTSVTYAGSGNWAGSIAGLGSSTMSAAVSAIVADLASITNGSSGGERVGIRGFTTGALIVDPGPIYGVLVGLSDASGINKQAGPAWANADTNPQALLGTYLDSIVGALAATTGNGGTKRIGGVAIPTTTGGNSIAAGSLYSQLVGLKLDTNHDHAPSGGITSTNTGAAIQELDTKKAPLASPTFTGIVGLPGAPTIPSTSITRAQTASMIVSSGSNPTGSSASLSVAATFLQKMLVPHGAVINGVKCLVAPGAHASLPGTLPVLTLWREDVTTGAGTSIGSVTDNGALWVSNNAAGYSTAHDLPITGLSETVDRTKYVYFVLFNSEAGANSIAITAYAARLTYTGTTIDIGY
jgi:hypothetical protein